MRRGVSSYRWWRYRQPLSPMRCRSFKFEEEETRRVLLKLKGPLYFCKSLIRKVSRMPSQLDRHYRKVIEKLSSGDSQINTLIWNSWLGGIIIETMIGANIVLEKHCNIDPHNVVITRSTRGLGKALVCKFLLGWLLLLTVLGQYVQMWKNSMKTLRTEYLWSGRKAKQDSHMLR
ncbi:hypothetical protein J5N97_013835 [Dioscorea zingiberensis]|uniref:Uncharacterized protein n=1 Tax=Dioscorea zingiberensis TaxID=325984 RepID=A0A9D5HJ46_9LILI|nr:hypothetical protein J5N97_013835 [Dioscorea zingiberensis]